MPTFYIVNIPLKEFVFNLIKLGPTYVETFKDVEEGAHLATVKADGKVDIYRSLYKNIEGK